MVAYLSEFSFKLTSFTSRCLRKIQILSEPRNALAP